MLNQSPASPAETSRAAVILRDTSTRLPGMGRLADFRPSRQVSRQREGRYRLCGLVEAISEPAWIADPHGAIVYLNRASSRPGLTLADRAEAATAVALRDEAGRVLLRCGVERRTDAAPAGAPRHPHDTASPSLDIDIVLSRGMDELLETLADVRDMPADIGELYSRSISLAILARLGNGRLVGSQTTGRKPSAPLPKWRLTRVIEHVEAHIDEPIRLADLAKAAGLTRMYFAAQFRAAMGVCPHDYVLSRRIRHAQDMLRDQRTPLVDVALGAGFQTQSHFTTVFKRHVGETPHRWRAQQALRV